MNAAGQARAHGAAVLSAAIRTTPADFFVEELDAFAPSGSGEHLLLTVEKAGMNTTHAARRIAQWAGVAESAVGYAGMKDRHAVTRQRFSVQLPGKADPDIATLETRGSGLASRETLRVLSAARHARKLPRGAHAGNRFVLVLRDVDGAAAAIDTRLSTIAAEGVPNSFGGQRFGRAGDNIAQALAMFGGRRVRREERSMLLSAARSALFNRVLAHRVEAGTWNVGVDGEVWMLDGTRSVFGPVPMDAALRRRVDAFDIHPTGPLWGRGALRSEGDARGIEEATLGDAGARALRDGLERAGLSQERRSLRLRPVDLAWTWPAPDMLELRFSLAPGAYATSLLAELGEVRDAHAASQGRSSDGMD